MIWPINLKYKKIYIVIVASCGIKLVFSLMK